MAIIAKNVFDIYSNIQNSSTENSFLFYKNKIAAIVIYDSFCLSEKKYILIACRYDYFKCLNDLIFYKN